MIAVRSVQSVVRPSLSCAVLFVSVHLMYGACKLGGTKVFGGSFGVRLVVGFRGSRTVGKAGELWLLGAFLPEPTP